MGCEEKYTDLALKATIHENFISPSGQKAIVLVSKWLPRAKPTPTARPFAGLNPKKK